MPHKVVSNIVKSDGDSNQYRGLLLENGLKVMLISDETSDSSACCLSCEVGHFADPEQLPGLAHFTEHMLFLGTEKYPSDQDYQLFVCNNGGFFNATTYADRTEFFFRISSDLFEATVDRFSQFFIAPLFTEASTLREIDIIQSEYEMKLGNDAFRTNHVHKALANPSHPFSKFSTGNRETLLKIPQAQNIDIRAELIKFYERFYSANLMTLAVYHNRPLDEMEALTVKYFGAIENRNSLLPSWNDKIFDDSQFMTKTFIVPKGNVSTLTLAFQTPQMDEHFKSDPDLYVSHLLESESEGSLLSELQKINFCSDLSAQTVPTPKGFGFFEIKFKLTDGGFEHIDEIIKLTFQYVNLMKSTGPRESVFNELREQSQKNFRFRDKDDPEDCVSMLTQKMMSFDLEEVLFAYELLLEWKPQLIAEAFERLNPRNCRVTVVGQRFADKCRNEEKWFGGKFHCEKIDEKLIEEWMSCGINDSLRLPRAKSVEAAIELLALEDKSKHPAIVVDKPWVRVFCKQDTEFRKPLMFTRIALENSIASGSVRSKNLLNLFSKSFGDSIKEFLYEASKSDTNMKQSESKNGLVFNVDGYSNSQESFVEVLLAKLFQFDVNEERFEVVREEYLKELKNFETCDQNQLASSFWSIILHDNEWEKNRLVDDVKDLSVADLKKFVAEFLTRLHVDCLLFGNVNKETAARVASIIEEKLKSTKSCVEPVDRQNISAPQQILLAEGENYMFEAPTDREENASLLYIQCDTRDSRNSAFVDIINQVISSAFFGTLRGEEQLGYRVESTVVKRNGAAGLLFFVQSMRDCYYLDSRITAFLKSQALLIKNMSEEDFDHHKNALIKSLTKKPESMAKINAGYTRELASKECLFGRDEEEAENLASLTKDEVAAFFAKNVVPDSKSSRSLLIHVVSTCSENNFKYEKICSIDSFKSRKGFF